MRLILCFAALLACDPEPPPPPPAVEPSPAPQPEPIFPTGFTGIVIPAASATVSARIAGQLVALSADVGDVVQPGDVVATLDDAEARRQHALERAALAAAEARLAEATVDRAELGDRRTRERALVRAGSAAAEELRKLEFAGRRAEAVRARLAAEHDQQQVRVEQQAARVADTLLRAPIAGEVAVRYHEPGSHVAAGEPLLRIVDTAALHVRFAVPVDAAPLAPGDHLQIFLPSLATPLHAEVRRGAPEVDADAELRSFEATLVIPAALRPQVRPGMRCRVFVDAAPAVTARATR